MKLADLEPRWINENMFAFRCPHCRNVWLTCKNVPMGNKEQRELLVAANLEPTGPRYGSVMTIPEVAWKWDSTDFSTMNVTPSVDASKSGHWHGFIRGGNIE